MSNEARARRRKAASALLFCTLIGVALVSGCGVKGPLRLPPSPAGAPATSPADASSAPAATPTPPPEALHAEPPPSEPAEPRKP